MVNETRLPEHNLHQLSDRSTADTWIADGRKMARKEGRTVFESIGLKYQAEATEQNAAIDGMKAQGRRHLNTLCELEERLAALSFDPARHLRDLARGRVDLAWAVTLTIVGVALGMVALSFGITSLWMVALLACLLLTAPLPVEEFFIAHQAKDSLREGIFLALWVLAVGASFWLGSLRGMFLMSEYSQDVGPVSGMLQVAGNVLKYSLGVLAIGAETLAGYKWFSVRQRLTSAKARAARKCEELTNELVRLQTSIQAAAAEPAIRHHYRTIGARQYLAEANRQPSGDGHLRRAFVGAGIALAVVLLLLFLAAAAGATPADTLPGTRVVLVDLTESSTAKDFEANVKAVEGIIQSLPDGGRAVVIGISDSFGQPRLLLDRTVRGQGSFGLKIRAAKESVIAEWRGIVRKVGPDFTRTSVIGALELLPYLLPDGNFILIILSDARENVVVDIDHVAQIDVPKALDRLRRANAISSLPAVRVYMLGVEPNGKSATYFRTLKEFWAAYFKAAGANLEAFRLDRDLGL